MAGVAGRKWDQDTINSTIKAGTLYVGLYTNNQAPYTGMVLSDFTEMTASGYSRQSISGGSWSLSSETSDEKATAPDITFSWTGSTSPVYGYFGLDGSGNVYLAELFSDGPYSFPSSGGSIVLSPVVTVG